MPLSFPIAATAREALDTETGARTIAEARELAAGPVTLVSEWLRPQPAEREEVQGRAEAGVARGFVQLYEDAKGRPVIAVTFWKPNAKVKTKPEKKPAAKKPAPDKVAEDTTDDLYFAKPTSRTKKRGKRSPDPNQLDLFKGPSQTGDERPDPDNPAVVLVEEEGSGEAFGIGPDQQD
jgi:hypothetical protein